MKISEQEVSRLLSFSPTERTGRSSYAVVAEDRISQGERAAQVDISVAAQEVQRITQLINRLPDVREDRVQALKAQIENGTYHVSSEDIADLIIRRALADNSAF